MYYTFFIKNNNLSIIIFNKKYIVYYIMIKYIDTFSKITLPMSNTLIVFDIDETILSFIDINKKWWNDNYERLLPIYKENTDEQVELLWIDYVSKNKPILLDEYNFKFFLNSIRYKCEIILLTARNEKIYELTIKHLNECKLNIHPSRIFFSKNKGKKLQDIVNNIFPNIKNIIFIDDIEENLISVLNVFNKKELSKYNLELYKIKHI